MPARKSLISGRPRGPSPDVPGKNSRRAPLGLFICSHFHVLKVMRDKARGLVSHDSRRLRLRWMAPRPNPAVIYGGSREDIRRAGS